MAFAEDIEKEAGEEAIIAIVVGAGEWYYDEARKGFPAEKLNTVLSWAEARPLLDYKYDAGYGGADCHAVYAYTETRVIYVHEYDGSTGVYSMPRNPIECEPVFA